MDFQIQVFVHIFQIKSDGMAQGPFFSFQGLGSRILLQRLIDHRTKAFNQLSNFPLIPIENIRT